LGKAKDDTKRYPKVLIEDEALFVAMKLAEAGYYGGDPEKVMQAPVNIVLGIISFRRFQMEWDSVYHALNDES
jgi:hypothetical protein